MTSDYADAIAYLTSLLDDVFLNNSPGPLFTMGYREGFRAAINCLKDPAVVQERIKAHKEGKAIPS